MANYNGLVATLAKASLTGTSFVITSPNMPAKYFENGQFACVIGAGHSGTIGIQVIAAIGGATFAIAGRTNITAAGSFPLPPIIYVGTSGSNAGYVSSGIPRPYGVEFASGAALGNSFNATVYFAGAYD